MGDRLLIAFSQRLTQTLRAADRFSITDSMTSVARLGGDEFVVLINSLPSIAAIESIGQRIPSLKDGDDDLSEDEVNKMLLENSRALHGNSENEAMSFTASFTSRIPRKGSPKKKKKRE